MVEEVDSGNDLGSYEIVNASDIPEKVEEEIAALLESGQENQIQSTAQVLGSGEERSQVLETEYRNKILDDLYEVKAQRLIELRNEDTLSHVQAVAPLVLQQYSPEIIESMVVDISMAISLLTNKKTRDLVMILNSKRFLDRLVEEKKHREVKLRESLKDVGRRRH